MEVVKEGVQESKRENNTTRYDNPVPNRMLFTSYDSAAPAEAFPCHDLVDNKANKQKKKNVG
jgi:hypothetical protein